MDRFPASMAAAAASNSSSFGTCPDRRLYRRSPRSPGSHGPLRDFALQHNGDLREEFGWNEMVKTVADIRDSLPPDQQAHLGIVTGNYGEYGAIEILGPAYGLPQPSAPLTQNICAAIQRLSQLRSLSSEQAEQANALFTNCRLAAHNGNSEGIRNEESQYHPDIFLCGPPRLSWPELWKNHQDFG